MISKYKINDKEFANRKVSFVDEGIAKGDVVFLAHSHFSNLHMWSPQIDVLAKSFRVVAYDIRGHGLSETSDESFSLKDLAYDAIKLMDFLNIEKVHFIGLSLGGMIAMSTAINFSSRLKSLVLADTSAQMPKRIWDERISIAIAEGSVKSLVKPTIERWFTDDFRTRSQDTCQTMKSIANSTSLAGYVGCAAAIREMDLLPYLKDISVPTCIIVGENDPSTPVEHSKLLKKVIKNAEIHILKNAAHLANLEQSEKFNKIILDFIRRQMR